jgi:hypothetical protein
MERRVTRNRSKSSTALKCHARVSSARRLLPPPVYTDKKVMASCAKVLAPEIIFNRRWRCWISAGRKVSREKRKVYSTAYRCTARVLGETLTR